MEKILVTTDFSRESLKVFDLVEELLLGAGASATVTLLNVIQPSYESDTLFGLGQPIGSKLLNVPDKSRAVEELQKIGNSRLPSRNISVEVLVANESLPIEIANYAANNNFSCIVIATHGRTGINHFLMGSVAEKLIQASRIPTYIVPCREKAHTTMSLTGRAAQIVAFVDLLDDEADYMKEISKLYEKHLPFCAVLHLVHVIEDITVASYNFTLGTDPEEIWRDSEQRSLEKLEKLRDSHFPGKLVMTTAIRQSGSIADTMLAYSNSHRAGLIVIGKHRRSRTERILLGSVAQKCVRNASRPVLIIPS